MRPTLRPSALLSEAPLASFRVEIIGYKEKHLPLDWQLFDASTGEELVEERSITFEPTVNEDTANWDVWVPLPRRKGKFFLSIELLLEKEHGFVVLSRLQTKPFPGLAKARAAAS